MSHKQPHSLCITTWKPSVVVVAMLSLVGMRVNRQAPAALAFDEGRMEIPTGRVTAFTFAESTVSLDLAERRDGQTLSYHVETTAPAGEAPLSLSALGWSATALQVGDIVTVSVHPAKGEEPAPVGPPGASVPLAPAPPGPPNGALVSLTTATGLRLAGRRP